MTEYQVVKFHDLNKFEDMVTLFLAGGWELVGGIGVVNYSTSTHYVQAMAR